MSSLLRTSLPSFLIVTLYVFTNIVSARLHGVNYSTRNGPDWAPDEQRCKSLQQVTTELQQIQRLVSDRIRVFSMTDCNTAEMILSVTQQLGMEVWLGIWVDDNPSIFDTERARMLELMNTYDFTTNVIGIHVSSEAIYREEITVEDAIAFRNTIKQDFIDQGWANIPVTIADIIDTNIEFPELITVDENVVTFNQFPFWETTVSISDAATYMKDRVALVEAQAGGRQVIVTETGWADAGSNPDANPANPTNAVQWLQDFICLSNERNWQYFWFDAYDNDWRRVNENNPTDVEGHFGIFYQNGTMKPYLQDLTLVCGDDNPITVSPTSQPVVVNGTTPPTTEPPASVPVPNPETLAPTRNPESIPNTTTAPVTSTTTSTPTSSPVLEVVANPTAVPTAFISTSNPNNEVESKTPIRSPVPTLDIEEEVSAQCVDNKACDILGLSGACCPTIDNWTLRCCGGPNVPHYQACANHTQCTTLGLEDACCPTADGKYLDCCGTVPDECLEPDACPLYSAVQYKLDLEAAAKSQGSFGAFKTTTTIVMIFTVISVVVV